MGAQGHVSPLGTETHVKQGEVDLCYLPTCLLPVTVPSLSFYMVPLDVPMQVTS